MKGKLFGLKTILLAMLTLAIAIPSLSIINTPINIPITPVEAIAANQVPVANFTLVDWVVGSNYVVVNGGVIRDCWNLTYGPWGNPCAARRGGSYDGDGGNLHTYWGIEYWYWDWGDGTTENNTYPATNHTYQVQGTYTIELNVTDDEAWSWDNNKGSMNIVRCRLNVTITSGGLSPPIANFTMTPAEPKEGEEITFNGSLSTDPDGTIVSYEWDFGDGNTATGVTATHTYAAEGVYFVTLTCTDNDDLEGSMTKRLGATQVFTLTIEVAGSNGTAIEGVEAAVADPPTQATTDATGTAVLELIEGPYDLTITLGTIVLFDGPIYINDEMTISITLDSSPYALIPGLQGEVDDLEADLAAQNTAANNNLYMGLGGGIAVGLVIGLAIMFIRK
jgi:PKD repeat protein